MAVSYELIRAPFSETLISEVHGLAEKVFGSGIDDGGAWRFENMPDFTVIEARVGEQLVGFKLGYAHTPTRYYSWLGGVDPEYRRQGIAGELMNRQHAWLLEAGYKTVETGARQHNSAMAELNLASGFKVVGIRFKDGDPEITYEKQLG